MKSFWMLLLSAMLSFLVYAGTAQADTADLSGQVSTDNSARTQAADSVNNDNSDDTTSGDPTDAASPSDMTPDQATPDTATGDDDY